MSDLGFEVIVKADCEATQHAVKDVALGERATRGFLEVVENAELLATLFVIPTDLEASGSIYQRAAKNGHEVALHVHPADQGYQEFLGVYGFEEQCKIIDEAAGRFAQVMGYRPASICIGYHSANDYTYPALVELGFRQGNNSSPGRILPECAAVWAGAPADIHYANAHNRLIPGTSDHVDIPCTNDPDSRMWGGKQPQDLRVELVDAKNHWYTIAKSVKRQLGEEVSVPYLLIGTHNTYDYSDPKNFRRQTLEKMIEHTHAIVEKNGANVKAATIESTAAEFRKREPLSEVKGCCLELDTSGRA